MVEQRHGVAHAEVPEDPDGALLGHAATELHDPRARAACRRHHVGIIPLSKQPLGPVLARIGLCDIHERLGMIGDGLFVADLTQLSQPRRINSLGAAPVTGSRGKPLSTHSLKPFLRNAPLTRRSP